ncbi:MAG: methyltransferase domain-containing protein [Sulfuricella sp.]
MSHDTMYEYYLQQSVFPTHGGFDNEEDLARHEQHRRELFTDKLQLPARLFKDASLLEFGPDTAENTLVFARWGANCKLVEPNSKTHPVIREYFQRFGMGDKLTGLSGLDVRGYAEKPAWDNKFDFVVAEGFIYTVRPESLWVELFSRIVERDGFAVLFYMEPFGSFFELMLKVVHSRYKQLSGKRPVAAAEELYQAKWDSIPHRRTLESFTMDVLENPFVRLPYFLEPRSLCRQMVEAGFSLYSSWPVYSDALAVRWFKKTLSVSERVAETENFIAQSRLSHMFGYKLFLTGPVEGLENDLMELLQLADGLIDRFEDANAQRLSRALERVEELLRSPKVIADQGNIESALAAMDALRKLLALLEKGQTDAISAFCNNDPVFIRTWGMPSHFAVFRKDVD